MKIDNGVVRKGDKVKFFNTGQEYDADEVGVLKMDMVPKAQLSAGEVGYIISGIKDAKEVKVGDTVTHVERPCAKAIEGFQEVKPMVFAGVYPIDPNDYENSSRLAGEAPAQRRLADLPARELPGPRLRIPLRIPRTAPHGDHPGAAGPRVQHGRDHDRPQRQLHGL